MFATAKQMLVVAQLVRASVFGFVNYKKHTLQSSPFLRTFFMLKTLVINYLQ